MQYTLPELYPLGDAGLVVQFAATLQTEAQQKVRTLSMYLDAHPFPGLIEYVPAFTSVTVFYDVQVRTYPDVEAHMRGVLQQLAVIPQEEPRTVHIPVCYGGELGPDLAWVAAHNGLTPQEVVDIHVSGRYTVQMIGFAPGFPYLSGMSERIAAPRRETPRMQIPAGSVGIAGLQTGIYSLTTPGGWQLIGRTPVALFQPAADPPCLLRAGDEVRFVPISFAEYQTYAKKDDDECA